MTAQDSETNLLLKEIQAIGNLKVILATQEQILKSLKSCVNRLKLLMDRQESIVESLDKRLLLVEERQSTLVDTVTTLITERRARSRRDLAINGGGWITVILFLAALAYALVTGKLPQGMMFP